MVWVCGLGVRVQRTKTIPQNAVDITVEKLSRIAVADRDHLGEVDQRQAVRFVDLCGRIPYQYHHSRFCGIKMLESGSFFDR